MTITIDGTTGIASVDGSAGSPSVRGSDANSGAYYAADTFLVSTAGVERLRISDSGEVGISHNLSGTSDYNRLMLHNPNDGSCWMQMTSTASGSTANSDGLSIGLNSSNVAHFWQREDAAMVFGTNGTERIQIRANGTITSNHGSNSITSGGFSQANYFAKQFSSSVLAGVQLEANGNDAVGGISQADDSIQFFNSYRSSAGYKKAEFRIGGAVRMTIATGGLISGDFNDTSDAKLKENVASIADGALAIIKQLRPVTFDWKNLGKEAETGHNSITGPTNVSGFLAQEVKPLIPSVVEGTEWDESKPDGDRYSINTNGLVAHLTKALQEAITKIETLETKVAALESA